MLRTLSLESPSTSPRVSPSSGAKAADVDQADDVVGVGGGVGDHRTAVGVADGEDRAWDLLEQAGDVGGVDGDAAQRIGGGRNLYPFCLQPLDHAVPARTIGKSAVHEDDCGPGSILRVRAHRVASLVLAFSTVLRSPCSVHKNAAGISSAKDSGVSWSICFSFKAGKPILEDVALRGLRRLTPINNRRLRRRLRQTPAGLLEAGCAQRRP